MCVEMRSMKHLDRIKIELAWTSIEECISSIINARWSYVLRSRIGTLIRSNIQKNQQIYSPLAFEQHFMIALVALAVSVSGAQQVQCNQASIHVEARWLEAKKTGRVELKNSTTADLIVRCCQDEKSTAKRRKKNWFFFATSPTSRSITAL